jgi:GntR family transcriptional regulator
MGLRWGPDSRSARHCGPERSRSAISSRPRGRWSRSCPINPNTVLKAYRELERNGLVAARPAHSTVVEQTLGSPAIFAQSKLRCDLDRWLRAAREAGPEVEDDEALFRAAVRDDVSERVA